MKELLIFGAGGFGREVYSIAQELGYQVLGFVDSKINDNLPCPVLGNDSDIDQIIKKHPSAKAFVAIGNSEVREKVSTNLKEKGVEIVSLIHPTSVISPGVELSAGVVIYPNVTVMTGSRIGEGVLLNSNVALGHDVEVGDFSNINLGASLAGVVKIGKKVLIGMNSSVVEGNSVADNSIIGAGAVVVKNIEEAGVYVGIPATKRDKND